MMVKVITIVGVGATGSHVAYALRNEGRINLVDFDKVEDKNVLSQLHSLRSVGKFKATSLTQQLFTLFNTKVSALNVKLTMGNVKEVLTGSDIVIDCTDNIAAKRLINSYCQVNDIPCLHTGVSADGGYARIEWASEFKPDSEEGAGATCEDGANLPFFSLVGGQTAVAAQTFLQTGRRINLAVTPMASHQSR